MSEHATGVQALPWAMKDDQPMLESCLMDLVDEIREGIRAAGHTPGIGYEYRVQENPAHSWVVPGDEHGNEREVEMPAHLVMSVTVPIAGGKSDA